MCIYDNYVSSCFVVINGVNSDTPTKKTFILKYLVDLHIFSHRRISSQPLEM